MKKTIVAIKKMHLKQLIKEEIKHYGNNCDLNHIDVTNIEDMSYIFYETEFNGDISQWNTSKVAIMWGMFQNSIFNGDISQWNEKIRTNSNSCNLSHIKTFNMVDILELFGGNMQ